MVPTESPHRVQIDDGGGDWRADAGQRNDRGSTGARGGRWLVRAWDTLALVACGLALSVGLQTVAGLNWPPDEDHFRDVAAAQAALDGHPLADPFYAGESVWYNPLVPWLVAAGAAATGLSPAVVDVRGGPWLNLLVPIAFYLFGARVAGRGAAFLALTLFIFWNGGEDVMASATYQPWLWAGNFSQALFYLGMLSVLHCAVRPTWTRAVGVGALTGAAFLAHTAAALVLGIVVLSVLRTRQRTVAAVAALVVASPFLYSIVGRYGLQVVNGAPLAWSYPLMALERWPELVRANAMVIGLGVIGAIRLRDRAARVALVAACGFLAYGLARDRFGWLPPLMPAFHFWRLAIGVLTCFAGFTVWQVLKRIGEPRAIAAIAAITGIAAWLALPSYRERDDFVVLRGFAQRRHPREAPLTAALRRVTEPGDVVLGPELIGLQVIGPAGARAVAVGAIWSNPYVPYEPRRDDLQAMLGGLREGNADALLRRAARYKVTHVIGIGDAECLAFDRWPLTLATRVADACIFRVARGPALPRTHVHSTRR